MIIDSRILKAVLVGSAALLRSVTGEALCVGIVQPPVEDPNFSPLSMRFDVHVTSKWYGLGNPAAVDHSFIQDIAISKSFRQSSDLCGTSTYVVASPGPTASESTTDISNHAGRDFSPVPAEARLTSYDTGYVTQSTPFGSISYSTYRLTFSIEADDYVPIWSDALMQFNYADYSRDISLDEYGLAGYYNQVLDLTSYLRSHIGTRGHYQDLVTIWDPNYQLLDKYGFEGTATLTDVTVVVPEPETFALLVAGLAMLCAARRRSGCGRPIHASRRARAATKMPLAPLNVAVV